MSDSAQPLRDLAPQHAFFIGIDSDGCAFDTMELKHKECFAPNTIKHWGLQPVSKYARDAALFVNLYSKWRGINRWPALVMVLDLLRERDEVIRRGVTIPQADSLRAFIAQEKYPHSDSGLRAYMAEHPGDPDLERGLAWTTAINDAVADMVVGVSPFPFVRESLIDMQNKADMIVVSATPNRALEQEWNEHGIAQYMRMIAGQEYGSKTVCLGAAAAGRYDPDKILMIGDAPGDMKAAKANGALFYPVNPGDEERSWERFYNEAMGRFFDCAYAGEYEAALIREFETYLPDTPPWKRGAAG
ncbi:MAG TPA: HAD hydrolase-like protein [Aggregatilinea sp.]|uniref:HAD family hydrolase n=1 Tax=Aggregatilinea sp. TaxID=2806333 RepID=UPI002D192D0B|nr:HAD hydrolase-like protein [Aggregatilinea sp.]HML21081.1 HAD hydrolase-like protein [Aggregatilinea sp.]